ncbi:nickel ABC transporter substrate-binding protein [Tepidibacter mesophilus]|uniref:nickel ABC transporter substrate-binding protein n=1 Tax=Tepidibacter mesophilus TaxID=655607 RepID=UPI000C08CD52|nr:nickel ABC transporter substrate-binding protein [Tepidibacter mesophilus]
MKTKKIASILLMLFLITMAISGCVSSKNIGDNGTDKNIEEKKATYLFVFSANTLNPHIEKSYIPLRAGIVETLVKIDEDLTLKPWLLESWKSEDAKHWQFKVRDGVTFHNGTVLNANMVKSNIESVIEKNAGIKNVLNIESVEANGQILNIVIKEPNLSFPSEFVHPNTAIIDVNAPDLDTKPIGTGPFKVESFHPNASIQLVKNNKYWDGEVKLDRVNFEFNEDANARLQALQSGYADIIFKPASESIDILKNNSDITVDSVASLRSHEIIYNMKKSNMDINEFRKGLNALINRKEIVDTIMAGQASPAYGPFLEKFPFAVDYEKGEFGLDKALSNFKKAGLTVSNGKVSINGKPLKMKIVTYASRPELPQIAQIIQSNAKKIGIEMDIYIAENIDEYLNTNNDWDISVYSLLTAPRGDASYFLNAAFAPEGVQNHGHINDTKLTTIIDKFNKCTDEKERNEFAKEAVELINKENYNSFIVYPNITSAYNNKRISGWTTSISEYYMITKDLDVK